MKFEKDIEWFRINLAPRMQRYTIDYRYFEEGDFGSLNQVDFNSESIGGNIDYWGLGWLGIYVWSFSEEKQVLNVLLSPEKILEKNQAFDQLEALLLT